MLKFQHLWYVLFIVVMIHKDMYLLGDIYIYLYLNLYM